MEETIEKEISPITLGLAAQAWCQKETSNKVMDVEIAKGVARIIDPLLDSIEYAWTIIANANDGDWDKANPEWKKAAEKFRDEHWHKILDGRLPKSS